MKLKLRYKHFSLFIVLLVVLAILTSACADSGPVDASSAVPSEGSPATSSYASSLAASSEASPEEVLSALPAQVLEHMRASLKGSALIAISPEGAIVNATDYPGKCYSNGQLSPNGRYLLCAAGMESGGEDFACSYTVLDLKTGKQYFEPTSVEGERRSIMSNDLYGEAYGQRIDSPEARDPVRFFTMECRPLGVSLAFDYGQRLSLPSGEVYDENFITGIGYNAITETYYLTYAADLSQQELRAGGNREPFSLSRLGIAVFNKNGTLAGNHLLPTDYMSPYSDQTLSLNPNNPTVLADGWLVVNAVKRDGHSPLLLIDPVGWAVKELPYRSHGSNIALTDRLLAAFENDTAEDSPNAALLDIQNGEAASETELPKAITVKGYPNVFTPIDVVWKDGKGYLAAYSWIDGYQDFSGLFRWDGETATLIHLLPPTYSWCNLLGTDSEGNCLVLLYGVTEQMKESFARLAGR